MRRVIVAITGALIAGALATIAALLVVRGMARASEGEDAPTCGECVTDSECEGACAPARMED